ncbi:hypothetical protein OKW21_003050 [Catalinimonas alkaloidigena]|uniref:carboxypeptidase-like regulatory domain-containing protein n=1 Tax=Catalinimonas alkaloidigena TaxID=1075417 RepID=UPI0024053B36|nr:carboxypeptidase-like regulatory domain-containing protein [Catalinimonas alkaloidigena]MDF9797787.1 hypothetical protein [Catalinimonas alkaloidigena]
MNKLSYQLALITCLVFGLQFAQAQNAIIKGVVTEASSGKPVSGAEVFLVNTAYRTFTTESGRYSLEVKPGNYTLASFYLELQGPQLEVKLAAEEVEKINFELKPLEIYLDEVETSGKREEAFSISRLNSVEGTLIYEAKKNEVIRLEKLNANLATNNARQVFANVPGLNVWESDAAGLQLGIGGRGLNPNRTSNFNTRQNGYDIAADPLGYPESYYTPPMESLEKIEVVRGAASLQYGTQFGGMINFLF